MAKPDQIKISQRISRYFSESFKRRKVEEIEKKISCISEISREYEVSKTSIYKWIYKYSPMKKKGIRLVVEAESDTRKLILLKERNKELERIIGQKQILIDFKDKMIELAEEEYKIDIKKKFGSLPFAGSGKIETSINTK
ncbi:MAG: transposase [Bacteroidetes bacterium]|nr:transposase [Bacteroidota bacterium]